MAFSTLKRNLLFVRLVRFITRIFFFPFFNIQTEGLKNIPSKGSFVLLPKHQRWEDIPILAIAIERPLHYMAKKELFNSLISNWFMSSLGGIPLDRQKPTRSRGSFERMIGLLEKDEGIVIFPEGTYFKEKMGAGYEGLIRMVLSRIDSVFIPVGIRYIKRRGRTLVRLSIGKPVGNLFHGNSKKMIDYIMKEIAGHSGLSIQ